VFSFGVLLCALLGNPSPFRRTTTQETMAAILRDPPELTGDLPSGLMLLIRRLLQKLPEDRYQSMAEVRADLAGLATAAMAPEPARQVQEDRISPIGREKEFAELTRSLMGDDKQTRRVGSAYDDLLAFPKDSRKEAGFELGKVQAGLDPADWKPFDDVSAGTREIRIRDASGIYRVMYVARFEEAIYFLRCFQKKTQVTSKQDKAIARARYRAVISARKETK
jgi:phage-related protein